VYTFFKQKQGSYGLYQKAGESSDVTSGGMREDGTVPTSSTKPDYCHCRADGQRPAHLDEQGVPEGFCGICERCGAPGHTRHYPGAVPHTGAWCDRCYQILRFRPYVVMAVASVVIAALVWLWR
jgi:hypothetical protein